MSAHKMIRRDERNPWFGVLRFTVVALAVTVAFRLFSIPPEVSSLPCVVIGWLWMTWEISRGTFDRWMGR